MTNKKYLPSVIVLYLNYFLHGIGCSVLGQAVIKDALSASWGVEAMSITAIAAALGLGRLIALPFAGPLSDKLGRRISTAIGGFSYAVYLIGLAMAFNAGGSGGYRIAYICAIIGGIANSFLDTGIYPAVAEIIDKAPGVATMGIKFAISGSQFLLPFFLGITVGQTAGGLVSYNKLFFIVGIAYLVLMALILFFPLPDTDKKAEEEKKEGLLQSIKHANFSAGSIQNFAKDVAGWAEPQSMQSFYAIGTMIGLVVTALLTSKIKDVRFVMIYPAVCLAMMVVVLMALLMAPSQGMLKAGAFVLGWFGAGGLLQIATSVCNMLFPKIKGTVTALVMIASSLCNYTILTAAASMTPSGVMIMNIVLTGIGVLLGVFVNMNYNKMLAAAESEK